MIETIVVIVCIYLGLKVLKGIFKLFVFIVAVIALLLLADKFMATGFMDNVIGTLQYAKMYLA